MADAMETDRVSVVGIFRDVKRKTFYGDGDAVRRLTMMMEERDHIVAKLPIAILNATQDSVSSDYRQAREKDRDDGFRHPCVVKYGGEFFVTDGHHRIMSDHADGLSSSTIRLFDLDGDVQLDFPLLDGIPNLEPDDAPYAPGP